MNAQQHDAFELLDLGNASAETKQHWISQEYPDHIFGRGPYPGWLELSVDRDEDLAALERAL